jgi:phosphoserine phosphatase
VKAEYLQAIADKEGIHINQTIAGWWRQWFTDVEFGGIRIAFAKPTVKEKAESSISSLGLDGVLYLLGATTTGISIYDG